ncbi:tRNA-specific 2-thiouridylase MnmA [Geodia barretti]|uniref:tRNA-5-taurinomethyluridine 2-sulfurtransferase n=1 Tax=Geodia barretti TaxID=519541 RepID=A0AA35VV89_GEOBA|nr:tRNA-specific 2-thiouridylase MnmA [Geodia barretti]
MKRVAIALSGGVDSLVAAILLKRSGASLVGVFMRNWEERDEGRGQRCTAEADYSRVRDICAALNIPCALADFVKDYWNDVFSHFVQAYEQGHTPNPDILCNRHIKFSALHRYCCQHLDADVIATGHYARVERDEAGKARLKVATDSCKDQTYFLSQVPQVSLARSVFPVGGLRKEEVREIASQAGFTHVARRKESVGLCFIGKRDFPQFISEYIEERHGRFVTLEGRQLGWHRGIIQCMSLSLSQ